MRQSGQIILILILVMTVALAIGLSIVQKSLVDISTASKVEQSSRAFSAAEAGVEKALTLQPGNTCGSSCDVSFSENSSQAAVSDSGLNPCIPGQTVGGIACPQAASANQAHLEYPPLSKEDVANVWLANLYSPDNPPSDYYKQSTLDVYWGKVTSDTNEKSGLELTLIYYSGGQYNTKKWFLDQSVGRTTDQNFEQVLTCGGFQLTENNYQCKKTISSIPTNGSMLIRARVLFGTSSQPFAVQATGFGASCTIGSIGNGCYLPPQARAIISTGVAGETQRKIRLFQNDKSVPSFFDYAIFSAGEINK